MKRLACLALVAAITAPAAVVRAEGDPRNDASRRALAEALFREGRERMESGAYAEGCPKLAESQRLDPHIGTLLNVAYCHAKIGRTATAWGEYSAAAAESQRAGRKENEASARAQMRSLEGQLSRVTIVAARPAADLVVKLDGQVLGSAALGSALPVDPGPHVLEATAPGRRPARVAVEVARGPASATITVPELVPVAVGAADTRGPLAASPGDATRPGSRSYTMPLALGGVAVASAVVGTIFGLEAFAKNRDAGDLCAGPGGCTQPALDADHTGHVDATTSTVAFIVAGAAAATAAVWLVIDKPKSDSVGVGLGPSGVLLRGSF